MQELSISDVDTMFVARFNEMMGVSDAWEERLRAEYEALDEDRYIGELMTGLTTVDFPGLFGMTPELFISYPALAQTAEARAAARQAVDAWGEVWRDLGRRWPALACILEIAYAPGDPYWEPIRVRAYETLATQVPFAPRHRPGLRKAIARRAREQQCSRDVVIHMSLVTGLMLAWGAQTERRRVRFGRQWVKSARTGRAITVTPNLKAISWPYFWKWMRQEAARLATADLLGEPMYPERSHNSNADITGLLDVLDSPPAASAAAAMMEHLDMREPAEDVPGDDATTGGEVRERLHAHINALFDSLNATPRERELAMFRAAHPDATSAEIADAFHIQPSTARVLLARLKQRLEPN